MGGGINQPFRLLNTTERVNFLREIISEFTLVSKGLVSPRPYLDNPEKKVEKVNSKKLYKKRDTKTQGKCENPGALPFTRLWYYNYIINEAPFLYLPSEKCRSGKLLRFLHRNPKS